METGREFVLEGAGNGNGNVAVASSAMTRAGRATLLEETMKPSLDHQAGTRNRPSTAPEDCPLTGQKTGLTLGDAIVMLTNLLGGQMTDAEKSAGLSGKSMPNTIHCAQRPADDICTTWVFQKSESEAERNRRWHFLITLLPCARFSRLLNHMSLVKPACGEWSVMAAIRTPPEALHFRHPRKTDSRMFFKTGGLHSEHECNAYRVSKSTDIGFVPHVALS